MGVLFKEVVLDLPRVVVTEGVGEFDLVQRMLKEIIFSACGPRAGKLVFVEDAEFHGNILQCWARLGKRELDRSDRSKNGLRVQLELAGEVSGAVAERRPVRLAAADCLS